jgi:two-component system, LytTR family, response regulator
VPDTKPRARLRALVVDDEPLARSNVTVLLERHADIELIGECGSGAEALETVRNTKPDLIFLDVQMPECDGFDVLEILGADLPPAVIFVTAYDEYALRAFEAGVLDYLLKPFDDARFTLAVERAKEKLARHDSKRAAQIDRIAVKSAGQVRFVEIREIDWIEAADYYACLHVGTKTHLLRRSMTDLGRKLDAQIFCRIHRSTIVNLDRVRGIDFDQSGEYAAILGDGTRLRLSRRYRKELQSRLSVRDGLA